MKIFELVHANVYDFLCPTFLVFKIKNHGSLGRLEKNVKICKKLILCQIQYLNFKAFNDSSINKISSVYRQMKLGENYS